MPVRFASPSIKIGLIVVSSVHLSAAYAQGNATGTLEHDKITAGQRFKLRVQLDTTPSYKTFVQEVFTYKSVAGVPLTRPPLSVVCNGTTTGLSSAVELECVVPSDADGGVYEPQNLRIGPPPGGAREQNAKIVVPEFEVVPIQDTNIYPKNAVATISLSQRQTLQSGAGKIDRLLDRLNTRVAHDSAESSDLKTFLSETAQTAQRELRKSLGDYLQASQPGSPAPIFFEDFDRQYTAFLIEVRTPQTSRWRRDSLGQAHLELAQLSTNQTVTVRPPELSSSLGPLVSKLALLMGNHLAAFLSIAESGSTTFTISLKSSPPGASVSYKRIGENYQDYSKPTDVNEATFPYALWSFRFTLGHCEIVKNPNPYIEKSPNLNPSMKNCELR